MGYEIALAVLYCEVVGVAKGRGKMLSINNYMKINLWLEEILRIEERSE